MKGTPAIGNAIERAIVLLWDGKQIAPDTSPAMV